MCFPYTLFHSLVCTERSMSVSVIRFSRSLASLLYVGIDLLLVLLFLDIRCWGLPVNEEVLVVVDVVASELRDCWLTPFPPTTSEVVPMTARLLPLLDAVLADASCAGSCGNDLLSPGWQQQEHIFLHSFFIDVRKPLCHQA